MECKDEDKIKEIKKSEHIAILLCNAMKKCKMVVKKDCESSTFYLCSGDPVRGAYVSCAYVKGDIYTNIIVTYYCSIKSCVFVYLKISFKLVKTRSVGKRPMLRH